MNPSVSGQSVLSQPDGGGLSQSLGRDGRPRFDLPASRTFPGVSAPRVLRTEVWLPRPIEEVFEFFADAFNLNALTPPWLHFKILTPAPIVMRVGAIIDYRIRLKVVPMNWKTEITAYEPPFRFIDEQRRGPYALWHHEHEFNAEGGGTLVADTVHYALPMNSTPLGHLAHRLLVRRDLEQIFSYRTTRMRELLGTPSEGREGVPVCKR